MNRVEFGRRLKASLDANFVKQADICRATGIPPVNFSRMISGQRGMTLETFAKVLEAMPPVNVRWLIHGDRVFEE